MDGKGCACGHFQLNIGGAKSVCGPCRQGVCGGDTCNGNDTCQGTPMVCDSPGACEQPGGTCVAGTCQYAPSSWELPAMTGMSALSKIRATDRISALPMAIWIVVSTVVTTLTARATRRRVCHAAMPCRLVCSRLLRRLSQPAVLTRADAGTSAVFQHKTSSSCLASVTKPGQQGVKSSHKKKPA